MKTIFGAKKTQKRQKTNKSLASTSRATKKKSNHEIYKTNKGQKEVLKDETTPPQKKSAKTNIVIFRGGKKNFKAVGLNFCKRMENSNFRDENGGRS